MNNEYFIQMITKAKNFLTRNVLIVAGVLLGAIAGFFYWKIVGCASGTCPITSVWYNSASYGAIMGGLLGSIFTGEKSNKRKEKEL